MAFCQINQKKKIMTTSVMLLLRMVVEEKVALAALEVLVALTFQIYLKISLVILVVEEEVQEEAQIIEGQI